MLDATIPLRSTRSLTDNLTSSALLLGAQGTYYLLTGLWPMVSMNAFQRVTGPKTDNLPTGLGGDHWLVLTVAVLVVAISLSLLAAAREQRASPPLMILAIAAALGLAAIDLVFVSRGVISSIYLLDAAAEAIFVAGWVAYIALRARILF
jgi:hypothetical protein